MAKYDERNKRWQLGLGLYFMLTSKHIYHMGVWTSRSNIPLLDEREFPKATSKERAENEVFEFLKQINLKKEL